jgi:hypothetical protein
VLIASVLGWMEYVRRRDDPCFHIDERAAAGWNDAARAQMKTGVLATKVPWANDAVTRIDTEFTRFFVDWSADYRALCTAPSADSNRAARQACLESQLRTFEAARDVLSKPTVSALRDGLTSLAVVINATECGANPWFIDVPLEPERRERFQNLRGELLTHVRDTGADPSLPSTRLYTTRAEQDFHTDGADIIGLACRRTARRGGESCIASSSRIVSEIQRTRPDLYPVLFEDFPWHYQEEGLGPFVLTRPIVSVAAQTPAGARLNTFFIPWYIRRSQELPDAPRLSAAQEEAIAMIEALANDPRFHLDMTFEPGDVQWLKNASILHKRTAYEDHDALEDKRHLLRLWLRADDFLDGDTQLRAGITEGLTR